MLHHSNLFAYFLVVSSFFFFVHQNLFTAQWVVIQLVVVNLKKKDKIHKIICNNLLHWRSKMKEKLLQLVNVA